MINFLAPKEFDIDRTGELIGISAMVDAIVEEGQARASGVTFEVVDFEQSSCLPSDINCHHS